MATKRMSKNDFDRGYFEMACHPHHVHIFRTVLAMRLEPGYFGELCGEFWVADVRKIMKEGGTWAIK